MVSYLSTSQCCSLGGCENQSSPQSDMACQPARLNKPAARLSEAADHFPNSYDYYNIIYVVEYGGLFLGGHGLARPPASL